MKKNIPTLLALSLALSAAACASSPTTDSFAAAEASRDRAKLAAAGILQNRRPDQFRFGQRETHSAAVHQRGIAGHRVRPADDRHAAVGPRVRAQIQRTLKLMALHAH